MGNLLGAPVTEKETERGCTKEGHDEENIRFAVSSMQGWRVHMEDAHIAEAQLFAAEPVKNNTKKESGGGDDNDDDDDDDEEENLWTKIALPGHALFAVFDGHGGSYSAIYAGRNLCRVLSRQPKFVEYAKLYHNNTVNSPNTRTPSSSASSSSSNDNNHENSNSNSNSNNNHEHLKPYAQLLESALTDCFVEIDKEICLAMKGKKVPDANKPYHPQSHSNTSSSHQQQQQTSSKNDPNNNSNNNNSHNHTLPVAMEDEDDSGTTACVVLLTPDCVVCANAGDSRAILRQLNGRTIPLSYDHKPDDPSEEQRIRAAGGYVAGGRVEGDLAVSRGLGDFRFKDRNLVLRAPTHAAGKGYDDAATTAATIQTTTTNTSVSKPGEQKVSPIPDVLVHPRNWEQDAFAMIACDGIWDVQTNEHASKLVQDVFSEGEVDLGLVCEEVCDICLRLGSKDNMTVLIFQFPAYHAQLQTQRQEQQQNQPSLANDAQSLSQPSSTTTSFQSSNAQNNNNNNNKSSSSSSMLGGVLSRRQAREAEQHHSTNVFSSSSLSQ